MTEGFYIEFNGDEWQSVFPSARSNESALHPNITDAQDYMIGECGIAPDQISVVP